MKRLARSPNWSMSFSPTLMVLMTVTGSTVILLLTPPRNLRKTHYICAPTHLEDPPRCVLRGLGVQSGPSDSPSQGARDGPPSAYPLALRSGRSCNRALLPHRRRLQTPQPSCSTLRVPQKALGLGGHLACALAAAPRRGERALVPARCSEVLL